MVTGWRKKRCLLCRVVVEGGPRVDKLESEVKGVVIGIYREDGVEEGGDAYLPKGYFLSLTQGKILQNPLT